MIPEDKMKILPITLLIVLLSTISCSSKQTKRYAVICSFGSIVHETEDKDEAFDRAKDLTCLGRVLPSKPIYFVIEK
jgi:hypothetical protein